MKAWIVCAALVVSPVAVAQSVGGTPFLAVHGHAELLVVPDIFPVTVELKASGLDVAKSQTLVEALTTRSLAAARSLGLADAGINVGDIRISPDQEYDQKLGRSVFRGNQYARTLEFRFRRLADVKAFVAAIPPGEQVQVSTGGFESSTANEIRRRLLVDAISDARKTADVLAAGIDRKVGTAQTISTTPMALGAGSYINGLDVANVESTTVLTAEQIARIPVPREVTSIVQLAPGTVRSDLVLEAGTVRLASDVYILYLLRD